MRISEPRFRHPAISRSRARANNLSGVGNTAFTCVEQFDRGADAPWWFSAIEVVVQLKRGTRRLASLYKNIKRFGLTPLIGF